MYLINTFFFLKYMRVFLYMCMCVCIRGVTVHKIHCLVRFRYGGRGNWLHRNVGNISVVNHEGKPSLGRQHVAYYVVWAALLNAVASTVSRHRQARRSPRAPLAGGGANECTYCHYILTRLWSRAARTPWNTIATPTGSLNIVGLEQGFSTCGAHLSRGARASINSETLPWRFMNTSFQILSHPLGGNLTPAVRRQWEWCKMICG